MSIANALSSALSGMTANARGVEVISSNLANALTPGYARRELELSPRTLGGSGGGVRIEGVQRAVTQSLVTATREATAQSSNSATAASFAKQLETLYGLPGDGISLSDTVSQLDRALTDASSRPDISARLEGVVTAAAEVSDKIRTISEGIQNARAEADAGIASAVGTLNEALEGVAKLNRQIVIQTANHGNAAGLMDERQKLIDQIAEFVPIREIPREGGQVALFSKSGAMLLDGQVPIRIDFVPTNSIGPESSLASGSLSGLIVNDEPVPNSTRNLFGGGSLSAMFEIRDTTAPAAQEQLDAYAATLYARFADPAADPTLAIGQAGLFTDTGAAFDPADITGFAGRLQLNTLVDPAAGGQAWRIRDGLNAAAPGDVGSASVINALGSALNRSDVTAGIATDLPAGTAANQAGALMSRAATLRVQTESRQSRDAAHENSMQAALMAEGVDSDQEMAKLLELEKAYAANAKVIQIADQMLESLMSL